MPPESSAVRRGPSPRGAWSAALTLTASLAAASAATSAGPEPLVGPPNLSEADRVAADLSAVFTVAGEPPAAKGLETRMAELGVPGVSVARIAGGRVAWARGWGMADVAGGVPVTPDTLFQAASISKPVAAMVALSLVDAGELELDGDVNDRLTTWTVPGTEEAPPVTLRHLLSHTAGLTVHGFPGFPAGTVVPTAAGVLRGEGNTGAVARVLPPTAMWRYSGGGYTVMEQLLEDVTGRPFAELADERVLRPLDMQASAYDQPLAPDRRPLAATGYQNGETAIEGRYHTYPQRAAAGLWTTPSDLARWAIALQDARAGAPHPVLSPESVAAMLEPGLGDWTLGLQIERGADGQPARFAHGGANAGFRCQLTAMLDGGDGLVVMTNGSEGGRLAYEILLTVAREAGWSGHGLEPEVKQVAVLDDSSFRAVEGRYVAEGLGEVTVRFADGRLTATASWGPDPVRLMPHSERNFFVRDSGMPVAFVFDDEATAATAMMFGRFRLTRVGG